MLRLYKREKLCSNTDIEALYTPGREDVKAALAYPLRAVWRLNDGRSPGGVARFMVVVPKRRVRHAVDRVAMRRRVREAYRLQRHLFDAAAPLDISFVYVAQGRTPYAAVERAMRRLLAKIAADAPPAD